MNITIQSVSEKDYEEIYQFENKNKAFFEQMLPLVIIGDNDSYVTHDDVEAMKTIQEDLKAYLT